MARHGMVIDLDAAIARLRALGAFTFWSTSRQDKSYLWREGQFWLVCGEDGGVQSEDVVSETDIRDAIERHPERFLALVRPPA